MRLAVGTTLALVAALGAAPALAAPTAYDLAFVSEFAEACVPQRLSYPGTQDNALAKGWTTVERSAHPELDAMMAISEAAAADPELIDATYENLQQLAELLCYGLVNSSGYFAIFTLLSILILIYDSGKSAADCSTAVWNFDVGNAERNAQNLLSHIFGHCGVIHQFYTGHTRS